MIRAGISGTNWTGKSTTLRSFCDAQSHLVTDIVALSTIVADCPYPTVKQQTPEASHWVCDRLLEILGRQANADVQLFDRSPIDIMAFTEYAFDRQQIDMDSVLLSKIEELLQHFDVLFFIGLPRQWPLGVFPNPEEINFARKMDQYIRGVVCRYKVKVVRLPWELAERQVVLEDRLLNEAHLKGNRDESLEELRIPISLSSSAGSSSRRARKVLPRSS